MEQSPESSEQPPTENARSTLDLTRAVPTKTEEELLADPAALMRNRAETEKAEQSLAQVLLDIEEARKELQSVNDQVRSAEGELASRVREQERVREETAETLAQIERNRERSGAEQARLAALRLEVEERLMAREALIEEIQILQRNLQEAHGESSQAGQTEPPETDEPIPLLLNHPLPEVTEGWDSYSLESEFFTDDPLDAPRVAELVKGLPGLSGSLIVRNHGPVLASTLPERFYDHLKVPHGNYSLLFERLPERVGESYRAAVRLATFRVGEEHLTVTQANDAFLIVTHEKPKLISGISEKLASITTELSKMYG